MLIRRIRKTIGKTEELFSNDGENYLGNGTLRMMMVRII